MEVDLSKISDEVIDRVPPSTSDHDSVSASAMWTEDRSKESVWLTNVKKQVVVPVICASRDYQGAPAKTIATIWNAIFSMNREPVLIEATGYGYSFVRTQTFQAARAALNNHKVVRGMLLDDDILVDNAELLIDAMATADKYRWNFVSPYRVRDGWVTIAHANGHLMTPEEVSKFEPWDRIHKAGLGFYYGDIPLDYTFHEYNPHGGEDLNFFHENPWIKPRIFDLHLKHFKQMPLELGSTLPMADRKVPPFPVKFDERATVGAHD